MPYVMGLDVGDTFVKGLVLKDGDCVCEAEIPTVTGAGFTDCLMRLAEKLVRGYGIDFGKLAGVGIGCPGVVESKTGVAVRAANLGLLNFPIKAELEKRIKTEVLVCNDANAAALGEARFGAGIKYSDSILVTLGTGVGGGVIIGGKLFEGNRSAGAEIGHMVIEKGGRPCTCGRRGCFEAYCSAHALTQRTREEMLRNPSSLMWKTYTPEIADGRTVFEYMDCDGSAKAVAEEYLEYLACGLSNLANVFRPQAIILGGGVSAQGDRLIRPLQKLLDGEIFAPEYAPVEIVCASLGNRAGAFGAAALFMTK